MPADHNHTTPDGKVWILTTDLKTDQVVAKCIDDPTLVETQPKDNNGRQGMVLYLNQQYAVKPFAV